MANVDAKLLRATKFPPEFNQKVDMQKVNLQVMKKWIASKIFEILGAEDDVVTELCFNLIEGPRYPDIKSMQIQLTGFLDKDTAPFCKDLWKLCLSAQASPQGVPKELLEAKKLELIQEKIDADKAAEELRVRRENQERRDRELSDVRDRDRRGRGNRGGRGDNWGGGRRGGDRAFGDRGRGFGRGGNRSPSPPRRERDIYRSDRDRYVPQGRRGSRQEFRRGRSPSRSASPDSRKSLSRSRSPSAASGRSRRASLRSSTPPRYRPRGRRSPPRYWGPAKRERSAGRARDYRARRNDRRRNSTSPDSVSRSESSRSRSPAPKRRRYSDSASRSRSPPRRDRDARRLSRSPSSSYARSRSRSPRRQPVRELISRSPSPNRRGRLRRSPTRSQSRSSEDGGRSRRESQRRNKEDKARDAPPRKQKYSANSPRPRDRSADVSEDEDRPQPLRHQAASVADEVRSS
ncbi:hypothetical protein GGR53DRAFT_478435 [Hypoxylon sp. FL1150]|nr:hypothetical protein GGR53DRAFT_478435 [Hypoxylon sp. FL1150]